MIGLGQYIMRKIETGEYLFAGVVGARGKATGIIFTNEKKEARTFLYYGNVTEFARKYDLNIDEWEVLEA